MIPFHRAGLLAASLCVVLPAGPARAASNATAALVTQATLIGGPAATAKAGQGDVLLQNDHIRVIIRGPGRTVSAAMFGGHIIDADLKRSAGQSGQDQFGQLSTFFNLAHSMMADTVTPFTQGLSAGTAGVRACGEADLFDFVDLGAGLSLIPPLDRLVPYDFNAPLEVSVCSTYTLGPDDKSVKIVTELENEAGSTQWLTLGDVIDGGSDVEYWLKNAAGSAYGKLSSRWTWGGFGPQPFGTIELMGFTGQGVSYGYATPLTSSGEADAIALSVAGVTVTALGTDSLLGTLRGSKRDLTRLPGRGKVSYTRYFIVGEDLAEVTAEAYRIEGITTRPITGTVVDGSTGAPLAGARVTALASSSFDRPVTQFVTDASGHFEGALPPGSYGLIAAHGKDLFNQSRAPLLTPVQVTVPTSGSATASLSLGPSATLALTVIDGLLEGSSATLPVRLSFYDPTFTQGGGGGGVPEQARDPLSLLMDTTLDAMRPGLIKDLAVTRTPVELPVPPGTWDVVITRGPEYNRFSKRISFFGGQTVDLTAYLTRVVDSDGYLSADLHVHAANSPDSPVDNTDRVRTYAADGVDLLVSTDHDFITDFRPIVDSEGLDDRLISLPGLELTTFSVGHFNAFPMPVDESHRLGGALDWADNDYVCDVGQDTSLPSNRDNLSPTQFLEALDACYAGDQLRQLNHARGELQGYFTAIGLDLSSLGTSQETLANPTTLRMAPGADLFDPAGSEVFEVMNEYGFHLAPTLLGDAFALLNLGYPKALTAVSDTHYYSQTPAGNTRTWLRMDNDDPATLNQDPSFADAFIESLGGMHATASSGPFLTADASRVGGGSAVGMGDTLSAPSGAVNLHIRIQEPRWMSFEAVGIFVNTPVDATFESEGIASLADLGPAKVWTLPDSAFIPRDVFVDTLDPAGASRLEFEHTQRLDLTEDSWIVVALWGGSVNYNAATGDTWDTLAFTSPIFVDVDGNGRFDAPCGPQVYDPAKGCDLVGPPSGSWGDRQKPVNHHSQWVYDLARIVQLEADGSAPAP